MESVAKNGREELPKVPEGILNDVFGFLAPTGYRAVGRGKRSVLR